MHVYNSRPTIMQPNDVANRVCLRADINRCFDRSGFVFFPIGTQFVAYVIRHERDYAEWYHRTPAQIHERVSIPFIYAHFAYNVISIAQVMMSKRIFILSMKTQFFPPTLALQTALAAQRRHEKRSRTVSVTSSEVSISDPGAPLAQRILVIYLMIQSRAYTECRGQPILGTYICGEVSSPAQVSLRMNWHARLPSADYSAIPEREVAYSDDHDYNTLS